MDAHLGTCVFFIIFRSDFKGSHLSFLKKNKVTPFDKVNRSAKKRVTGHPIKRTGVR